MKKASCLLMGFLVVPAGATADVVEPSGPGVVGLPEWLVERALQFAEELDPSDNVTTQAALVEEFVDDVLGELNDVVLCVRSFTPWITPLDVEAGAFVPTVTGIQPVQLVAHFDWVGVGTDDQGETRIGTTSYELRLDPLDLACDNILGTPIIQPQPTPLHTQEPPPMFEEEIQWLIDTQQYYSLR